jgi:hypothetical protein
VRPWVLTRGRYGSVGPLFHAIIVEQFTRTRAGDKWWYERPGVLDPSILQTVKATTAVGSQSWVDVYALPTSSKVCPPLLLHIVQQLWRVYAHACSTEPSHKLVPLLLLVDPWNGLDGCCAALRQPCSKLLRP